MNDYDGGDEQLLPNFGDIIYYHYEKSIFRLSIKLYQLLNDFPANFEVHFVTSVFVLELNSDNKRSDMYSAAVLYSHFFLK